MSLLRQCTSSCASTCIVFPHTCVTSPSLQHHSYKPPPFKFVFSSALHHRPASVDLVSLWLPVEAGSRTAVCSLGRLLPRIATTTTAASSPAHTLDDYNHLLAVLAWDGDGDADAALRVLRCMRQASWPATNAPTAASYISTMSALSKADRPTFAEVLLVFEDTNMVAHGVDPECAAFTLLVHIYSSNLNPPSSVAL